MFSGQKGYTECIIDPLIYSHTREIANESHPDYGIPGTPANQLDSTEKLFSTQQVFDSVVVIVETDAGISGFGEVCTIGILYMRGLAEGAVAGVPILAQTHTGEDPFHVE